MGLIEFLIIVGFVIVPLASIGLYADYKSKQEERKEQGTKAVV